MSDEVPISFAKVPNVLDEGMKATCVMANCIMHLCLTVGDEQAVETIEFLLNRLKRDMEKK